MTITNQYFLPDAYVRSVSQRPKYEPNTISVTALLTPPQIRALELQHEGEILTDASSRHDIFMGLAVHHYLAFFAGADNIAEERLRWTDPKTGWIITGQPDHLSISSKMLTDWKTTRVRSLKLERTEHEQQTNLYAHLARLNGYEVEELAVWYCLKDWDPALRSADPAYPRAAWVKREPRLWDSYEAHEFMLERLRLHRRAVRDGIYNPCTAEERWQRPSWAVWSLREKTARATRVFDSYAMAATWAQEAIGERPRHWMDWYRIEEREGDPLRCRAFCPVSEFCSQYAEWKSELELSMDTRGVRDYV